MKVLRFLLPALAALLAVAGCAAVEAKRDLHDMETLSISGEEVWDGTVYVDKIVIVRKGGHLTVKPGAKILFRRVDWDGDKIGDAELTVEGRLTAVGTREAPILFASAEESPGEADWKYLHVNFAAGAKIEFARVSNAFSGIQVHYSKAEIKNSDFAHNVDGIRFSTADLNAVGNWSRQNRHGVRFEERGHPARIEGNLISGNEVGIFAVTQCRGQSLFSGNDISRNGTAVKMGWEQKTDLDFPGNWWGEPSGVGGEAFMDKRIDEALGSVGATSPMLEKPLIERPFPIPADPDWERITRDDLR